MAIFRGRPPLVAGRALCCAGVLSLLTLVAGCSPATNEEPVTPSKRVPIEELSQTPDTGAKP